MSISHNSNNLVLDTKRHSMAHILAAAVQKMFPEAQFGVGPVIENGCYYDFILPRTLIPEDLPLIEKHMREILKRNAVFKRQELSISEAILHFEKLNQALKVELLQDLATRGTTSMSAEERADFEENKQNFNLALEDIEKQAKIDGVHLTTEVFVANDRNQIFGQKRSENRRLFPGAWDVPGGHMEEGESLFDCLVRELKEETNWDLEQIVNITGTEDWEVPAQSVRDGENTKKRMVKFLVKVKNLHELVLEKDKVSEGQWFSPNSLDRLSEGRGQHVGGDNWRIESFQKAFNYLTKIKTPIISIYRVVDEDNGEVLFEDLCKGPHVEGIREPVSQKFPSLRGGKTESFDGVETLPEWEKQSLFAFWDLPKNENLSSQAKELRQAGVLSKTLFWQAFNKKGILGFDIDRQFIIGNYIVDFFIPELGLAIEIDGESHDFKGSYDNKREEYLQQLGLEVLHFQDAEIKKNIDFVADSLQLAIKKRKQFLEDLKVIHPVGFADTPQEGNLGTIGFALDKFSASYWRGDQARDIRMQRIYALVFDDEVQLEDFVNKREEAKKRDHRFLNETQKYYTISELVGAGLPLMQPKGNVVRKLIQSYLWQLHKPKGYQEVWTPHIGKELLYETSGHAKHYLNDMFSVHGGTSKENFYLKPMNCPHHMQLFADNQFSYKDMPIRYFEHATVYRDEKTGQLAGLTRVRNITQDDGHLFCRLNQLTQEINTIVLIIKEFMSTFNMVPKWVSLSIRDNSDGWLGTDEMWTVAENALKEAAIQHSIPYRIVEGEAAFYGPKLDFMFTDILGRQQQLSTIQIDFNLPERFDLSFINEQGENEKPVVVHRAISGSAERFMGVLIEHFAGRFPFWLSPVQVKILTVNDQVQSYVDEVQQVLDEVVLMKPVKYNELRYEIDDRSESLGKKIREAEMQKIPVLLIVGPKDEANREVSVRTHEGEKKLKLEELGEYLKNM